MYSTFFTVALFLAPAFAAFAINQPELTQCEDATISWAATENPPYNLIVVPAADPCGSTPFYELDTSKTKITWKANVPAGTKVVLSVVDSGDEEVWSRNITVKGSNDKSCLAGASASLAPSFSGSAPSGSIAPSTSPSTVPDTPPAGEIVDPVGAANAGTNDLLDSAAPSNSRLSQSVMALAAVGAVVALAL